MNKLFATSMLTAALLAGAANAQTTVVTPAPATATTVVSGGATPAKENANTAVGATTGAAAGAIVGGPVGALVGAAIGSVAGNAATPKPEIRTYIDANPQQPVNLSGDLVVGAGIPDSVTLYEIPDQADYKYLNVNGKTVLVNPADRRVVYIYE